MDCVNTEIGFFPYLPRQHNRPLQNPQIPASSVNEPLYHLIEAFQAEFKVSDSKQRENLINIFELSKWHRKNLLRKFQSLKYTWEYIKISDDRIRTGDICIWKQPFDQLSHIHCLPSSCFCWWNDLAYPNSCVSPLCDSLWSRLFDGVLIWTCQIEM